MSVEEHTQQQQQQQSVIMRLEAAGDRHRYYMHSITRQSILRTKLTRQRFYSTILLQTKAS